MGTESGATARKGGPIADAPIKASPSHTPGPWHVVGSDNATPHIMHEGGKDRYDIDDHTSIVCVMPAEILHSYNSWANARLIAAAPDLLEICQAFIAQLGGPEGYFPTAGKPLTDQMRAAIAKATGAA